MVVGGVVPGLTFNQNVELHLAELSAFLLILAVACLIGDPAGLFRFERSLRWARRKRRRARARRYRRAARREPGAAIASS